MYMRTCACLNVMDVCVFVYVHTERQKERKECRQTGRQAGRQTDRQTDRQVDRQRQMYGHKPANHTLEIIKRQFIRLLPRFHRCPFQIRTCMCVYV